MGVIAKGILRGCQGLFTPVSLGYPLSVFNKKLYSQRPYVACYSRWGWLVGWLGLWATFWHVCHGKKEYYPSDFVAVCGLRKMVRLNQKSWWHLNHKVGS